MASLDVSEYGKKSKTFIAVFKLTADAVFEERQLLMLFGFFPQAYWTSCPLNDRFITTIYTA